MTKVVITHFALHQINSIYNYFVIYSSVKVAKKIKLEIISAIKTLKKENVDWQEEEFLINLKKNQRRLICGNYKIIYYHNSINSIIYVTDVFDSRQNPIKEKG